MKEVIEGLKEAYEKGVGLHKLAKKHHRDTVTIKSMLLSQGVVLRRRTRKLPGKKLRKAYEKGATLGELAKTYGCATQTVADRIVTQGGTIRTAAESKKLKGREPVPLTPELIAEIKAKYPTPGWSIPRLAKETGVLQKDIRQLIVDDPNIELRKPGRHAGKSKGR